MRGAQKSECPVGAGQVAKEATKNTGIVALTPDDSKALANTIAGYALAGYAVHQLSCGGFLVARWNLTKHCPDLRSLVAFARQIGVRL